MVKNKAKKAKMPATRKESSDSMLEPEPQSEDNSDDVDASSSDDGFQEAEAESQPQKRKLATPNPFGEPKKKKKSIHNEEPVVPPTLEEMKELRDTRNLFHSNLFKLQVKELLEEVQLKPKYTTFIESWLESFKNFVQQLEDGLLDNCQLAVPLNLSQLQHKKPFNFQFIKPTKMPQLVGAAATGTLLGPQIVVDVAVEMPAACFQKEDYLNLIYDQKRALYLTYLANKMRSAPAYAHDNFCYNYHNNNPLKPVLLLTPADAKVGKRLQLRLFIVAPSSVFKLSRFVPWNSNIRPSIFNDEWDAEQPLPVTPHYNAHVLADLTLSLNQALICQVFEGRRNFQQGLLLLKVWLRQRQLDIGHSGFGAHILAAFIVYLNQQRTLHQSSSSYQVARSVWNQLANSDWTKGITLAATQPQPLSSFTAHYDVCFMDATGYQNLCANLSLDVYRRVCAEAKLAVELLNDNKLNSFPLIFMHKCPLYSRVDNILSINKPASVDQLLQLHATPHLKYDYGNYAYPQLLKLLTDLLHRGLGQRIIGILPLETPTLSWPVDSQAPLIGRTLQLGLILNPEHAYEVLDKGPEAIDAAGAAEFRKFWGDKANLRRFQDGSITEAVVWCAASSAPRQKRLIVRDIVLHLLEQHLQLESNDVQYTVDELDLVYTLTPAFKIDKLPNKLGLQQQTDAEALTPHIIHCYDELARQLHQLDELPLEIVSIAGISPVFRYCEPEPVLPQARITGGQLRAAQVHRVIIQLGASGKWPQELAALRALKTAFYIQIAALLLKRHRLQSKLSYEGLLVLKRGYCFQLELAHSKEVALLKHELSERGITRYVDCAESRQLERRHYILPKVSGALHSLQQTHSAFGPTVLIAKRWLGAQLLDEGMWPDMATELLVAHLFLQRQAPQQICAPQTGIIRLLQLLAHTDWSSELFLLNFNNSWEEHQISDLEHSFRSSRQSYPPLCIATAYDQQHAGQLWSTVDCPNVPVLTRVTMLARHALQLIETSLLASSSMTFVKHWQLFKPSSDGYDLVIQLKPDLLANTLCFDLGSPFSQFSQPNFRLPLACSEQLPRIVAQLREAYSDYAAFFYNPYGGKELAIVWKPANVFAPKAFKVNELQACTPSSSGGDKVQILRETLLADFKFLLKDFYLRVCTPAELKREQREAPKRYFNSKPPKAAKVEQPSAKAQKLDKLPKSVKQQTAAPKLGKDKQTTRTGKRLLKSTALRALK